MLYSFSAFLNALSSTIPSSWARQGKSPPSSLYRFNVPANKVLMLAELQHCIHAV